MKKIILRTAFVLISVVWISCTEETEETNTHSTDISLVARTTEDNYIAIKASTVTANWKTANNTFIADSTTINSNLIYYINLNAIYDNCLTNSTSCDTSVSNWLNENDDYIDFEVSFPLIEEAHRVSEQTTLYPEQSQQASLSVYEFYNELKDLLDESSVEKIPNNYNQYISLSIENGTLVLTELSNYNTSDSCYSLPFLKSLLIENKLTENSSKEMLFTEKINSIHIQIPQREIVLTYDYTDNPTLNN
ncbi:hypothetical protein NBRC110019_06980 [Neptunitalea chrysea]|uniref:Uncharacterized protein n=1 Tax=Neptunitalea chrysea TaxID=1647581 RepID=A0A9W6B5H2_9FLAO|nr:hypothetical protein [Neptunitalea chrysea]GLB51659.1 hypothetical protein NBRC110019_06980 [Neptunitalea chrysea]